MGRKNRNS